MYIKLIKEVNKDKTKHRKKITIKISSNGAVSCAVRCVNINCVIVINIQCWMLRYFHTHIEHQRTIAERVHCAVGAPFDYVVSSGIFMMCLHSHSEHFRASVIHFSIVFPSFRFSVSAYRFACVTSIFPAFRCHASHSNMADISIFISMKKQQINYFEQQTEQRNEINSNDNEMIT